MIDSHLTILTCTPTFQHCRVVTRDATLDEDGANRFFEKLTVVLLSRQMR